MIKKFIRGNEKRGAEVIKTLEDLGGVNKYCKNGDADDYIYYINRNNSIDCIDIESTFADIIEESFEEIKLPEKNDKVITNLDVAKWYFRVLREGHAVQFMYANDYIVTSPWDYFCDDDKTNVLKVRVDFGKWTPVEEAGIKEIVKDSQY